MSAMLAARGHEVITYAPLPDDMPSGTDWRGTKWFRLEETDWSLPGVWVLYRCPNAIDNFDHSRKDQVLWLLAQDWSYPDLTTERISHLDRFIVLCHAHRRWLAARQPELASRFFVSRNGIRLDLIAETEAAGIPERNMRRIMFASSPDRGLVAALKIFRRAKEFVPDLQFFASYGYNNIDKLIAQGAKHFQKDKDEALRLMEETGAQWLGRVTQQQLYREWQRTGLWTYATTFWETGPLCGDTLVETLAGPVPIRDLVGRDPFPVYSCDSAGNLSVSTARDVTLKRKNAPVVRVTFRPGIGRNANKETTLTLTPDHEVMLRDGTYKPAGQLVPGDRVKAFHQHADGWGQGYANVGVTDGPMVPAHRFVAERAVGRPLADGEVVDHMDTNTRNNEPGNLVVRASQSDHAADHFQRMTDDELAERRGKLSAGVRAFQESLSPEQLNAIRKKAGDAAWAKINALPPEQREAFLRSRVDAISDEGWERRKAATAKMNRERFQDAPWRDKELLARLYVTEKVPIEDIAKRLGCSVANVYLWIKKHDIPLGQPRERRKRKTCSNHVVVSVEDAGWADVYCMEADPDHNFVANGIFVHNCITGLEAMALGAIPLFSPIWAQAEHCTHGVPIAGDPSDPLTIAKFAAEVVRLTANDEGFALQEKIRAEMMPDTRSKWGWDQFAWKKPGENWEQAAEEDFAKKAGKTSAELAPSTLADNPDEAESRKRWLHLSPGDVFLDVGACDGSWTLPAAKMGATVYAIDPQAEKTRLCGEVERANVVERVNVLASKVGDTPTDDAFTLDSLALEADLQSVAFIKVDVEGEELAVLRGAQALLRRFKPDLMVEVHTETVPGVCVRPGDVTAILDELKVGYAYTLRRLEYQGGTYWHLFATVRGVVVTATREAQPPTDKLEWFDADGRPLADGEAGVLDRAA